MDENQKPKRGWMQFSLRTMIIALTLALVLLGHEVNCWRQHLQDVRTLTRAGVTVGVASCLPAALSRLLPVGCGEHICVVMFAENAVGEEFEFDPPRPGEPFSDIEKYFLMNIGQVRGRASGAVSKDAFAAITHCRQLQAFSLLGKTVDDEQARKLADLPRLQFVNLGCSPVTAEGVAPLLARPQLRFFHLYSLDLKIDRDLDLVPVDRDP